MPTLCLNCASLRFQLPKLLVFCAVGCTIISAASAQDFGTLARQQYPAFLGVGVYFPTVTGSPTNCSAGPELVAGARAALDHIDLVATARGRAYYGSNYDNAGGTFQVALLSADVLFRADRFYAGPGLGTASSTASITLNGDGNVDNWTYGTWQTVWSLTAGVDITNQVFIETRWQSSNDLLYRGYSISAGYRF